MPELHNVCTERQKKLITSSERHSLKSKASKWIMYDMYLDTAHQKKKEGLLESKWGVKMWWYKIQIHVHVFGHVGHFWKITETARLLGWKFAAYIKSQYGGYITRPWNWMNSYLILWIGFPRGAHSVSSFCDFSKMTFCDFAAFFSFCHKQTFFFFQMFFNKEYLLKLICV